MGRRAGTADEALLSEWFAAQAAAGRQLRTALVRDPAGALAAARRLAVLPVHRLPPPIGSEGRAVRRLLHRSLPARLLLRGAFAALEVPDDVGRYLAGPARKDLRQYVRTAERLGVAVREVPEAERPRLLAIADERERTNPRSAFRTDRPDNRDALTMRLWVVAEDAAGTPLLLAVVAVQGPWSVLRYFRTLADGPGASTARYLVMAALVPRLRALDVRWLVERSQPQWLPDGLRGFQRRVGFRLVRLRLSAAAPARRDRATGTSSSTSP